MGAFISAGDLETALGSVRYNALFDDDNSGIADIAAVDQVILRAETRMSRYAREGYGSGYPPSSVPDEFKAMALEYALAYAEARRPEVSRQETERRLEAIDLDMKDIAKGLTSLTQAQPSPAAYLPEDAAPAPGALGASLVSFDDSSDVCTNGEWIRKEGCR